MTNVMLNVAIQDELRKAFDQIKERVGYKFEVVPNSNIIRLEIIGDHFEGISKAIRISWADNVLRKTTLVDYWYFSYTLLARSELLND